MTDDNIITERLDYRIALRPYDSEGGAGQSPDEWDHDGSGPISPPLDDIVVKDVEMFRMEDMGDHFWMCCYLTGIPEGAQHQRILVHGAPRPTLQRRTVHRRGGIRVPRRGLRATVMDTDYGRLVLLTLIVLVAGFAFAIWIAAT